ncbi:hypothetical protein JST97_26755, partial [bacterium]|nr:hypothetical protein [bacterium]
MSNLFINSQFRPVAPQPTSIKAGTAPVLTGPDSAVASPSIFKEVEIGKVREKEVEKLFAEKQVESKQAIEKGSLEKAPEKIGEKLDREKTVVEKDTGEK